MSKAKVMVDPAKPKVGASKNSSKASKLLSSTFKNPTNVLHPDHFNELPKSDKPRAAGWNSNKPTVSSTVSNKPTASLYSFFTKPTASLTNPNKPTASLFNSNKPTASLSNSNKPTASLSNSNKPIGSLYNFFTKAPTSPFNSNKPAPSTPSANKPAPTLPSANKPAPTPPSANKPVPTPPSSNKPAPTPPTANKPALSPPSSNKPAPSPPSANKPIKLVPVATSNKPAELSPPNSTNSVKSNSSSSINSSSISKPASSVNSSTNSKPPSSITSSSNPKTPLAQQNKPLKENRRVNKKKKMAKINLEIPPKQKKKLGKNNLENPSKQEKKKMIKKNHENPPKEASIFKTTLSRELYALYNRECFDDCLPKDMTIDWNVRLRRTGGRCYPRRSQDRLGAEHRSARIELSTKVIDSCARLAAVLLHEMCHAAAWMAAGEREGHGPVWTAWADKATERFPKLAVVDKCHSFDIRTKFTYRCEGCGYEVGRHSKSVDTARQVCGHCRGKFQLVVNYRGKVGRDWRCDSSREEGCIVCQGRMRDG